MLAPAAHATELFAKVTNPGFTDTFDIESNGGVADTTYGFGASYIDFAITNDSSGYGFNTATFGDVQSYGYLYASGYPRTIRIFRTRSYLRPRLGGLAVPRYLDPSRI